MSAAQVLPTSSQGLAPIPPPPGYPIGTILYGKKISIGNLWIITKDMSFEASLLYDGKNGIYCATSQYKRDTMSAGMLINKSISTSNLPLWAANLVIGMHSISATKLSPQIQASMGLQPFKDAGLLKPRAGIVSMSKCPSRLDDMCVFIPYHGFTENYDYCKYCDRKRSIPK